VATGDPALHRDAPERWQDLQLEVRNLQSAAQILIESGDCEGFTRMAWGMFHWVWRFGHIETLARWAERALTACGSAPNALDPVVSARLRAAVSWSRFLVGDVSGALAAQDDLDLEAVAESDPACAALLQSSRAMALPVTDGGSAASAAAERALVLADLSAFVAVRAYSHALLAALDLTSRDLASAERHCRECLSIATTFGLHSLAGQQYAQLALAAIAQGDVDEGRRQLTVAFDTLHVGHHLLDVAFLLGHAAVLAAAEGRMADATHARGVSDALVARLGLWHWHVFEGARDAALGSESKQFVADTPADLDTDPWELLHATLNLPALASDSRDISTDTA
jgi:hypothetical protein